MCLLRYPKSELMILITIFLPYGIGRRERIGNPDFYQRIFRKNTKDVIKTSHLVCSVLLTNKIVLNAAEGKRAFAEIIGIPRQ